MKHFALYELVPKTVYTTRGVKAWELFDPRLLETMDRIRELFGRPITINNWYWEGQYENRGYRPYKWYVNRNNLKSQSQHIAGRAFDFDVKGMKASDARKCVKIMKADGELPHLTGFEEYEGMNWVHIDVRAIPSHFLDHNGLYVFKG